MSAPWVPMAAGLLALAALAAVARAQPAGLDPAAWCSRIGTDDALRSLPPGLADAARARFGLRNVPARTVARSTVWRCDRGRALLCFAGANLPCGKLDGRTVLPAAETWCEEHPNAPIPAVVTGHGSLWRWRCEGTRAVRDSQAWAPDRRGFARETWRPLTLPN